MRLSETALDLTYLYRCSRPTRGRRRGAVPLVAARPLGNKYSAEHKLVAAELHMPYAHHQMNHHLQCN